jgi:hypothetical protein
MSTVTLRMDPAKHSRLRRLSAVAGFTGLVGLGGCG